MYDRSGLLSRREASTGQLPQLASRTRVMHDCESAPQQSHHRLAARRFPPRSLAADGRSAMKPKAAFFPPTPPTPLTQVALQASIGRHSSQTRAPSVAPPTFCLGAGVELSPELSGKRAASNHVESLNRGVGLELLTLPPPPHTHTGERLPSAGCGSSSGPSPSGANTPARLHVGLSAGPSYPPFSPSPIGVRSHPPRLVCE